jgi:hypothetical protein
MRDSSNPYVSPSTSGESLGSVAKNFAPCPRCGQSEAMRIGWTWWGGYLGPRLLTHVKCRSCGAKYHGLRGTSNVRAILVYSAVSLVAAIGLTLGLSALVLLALSELQP